jgi:hypothetical protein
MDTDFPEGGDSGPLCAYLDSYPSRITCHLLQNLFSGVFLLASSTSFRQNTFTYLDEASLTEV